MDYRKYNVVGNAEAGAALTLKDFSTGEAIEDPEGNPIVLTVLGKDSKTFRDAALEIGRKALDEGSEDLSEVDERATDLLSRIVTGWSWMFDPDSLTEAKGGGLDLDAVKPLECNPENVRKIIVNFRDWRDQIDAFVDNRANFTPASSKT